MKNNISVLGQAKTKISPSIAAVLSEEKKRKSLWLCDPGQRRNAGEGESVVCAKIGIF